jgi:hypothetical protein
LPTGRAGRHVRARWMWTRGWQLTVEHDLGNTLTVSQALSGKSRPRYDRHTLRSPMRSRLCHVWFAPVTSERDLEAVVGQLGLLRGKGASELC